MVNGLVNKKQINSDEIKLIDFISDIQRIKSSNLISKIGNASEACFNIEEHSVLIHSRVVRILKIMQLEKINVEKSNENNLNDLGKLAEILAEAEGLDAHRMSINSRKKCD